ncbi:hypothetical protein PIB30_097555 [Stylosanthes scabra]|uniref:Uncharacterized protein n=1 Tax=Stylosanthes scabra TaxID=79078 RepID=A0ABU6YU21_9FABA|nr:hypothetical protein [Stylosanthes scabra]
MVNQDEEGVAYTDHSGDEQRRDQQPERQQEELDLNATANDGTRVNDVYMDLGASRTGVLIPTQPTLVAEESQARSTSAGPAKLATTGNNADHHPQNLSEGLAQMNTWMSLSH